MRMLRTLSLGALMAVTVGASGCLERGDDCHIEYHAPEGVFACSGTRLEFDAAASALVVVAADGHMHWEKWQIYAYRGLHVAFGRNATASDPNDSLYHVGFASGRVEVGQFIGLCGKPTDLPQISFNQPVWDFSIWVDVRPNECGGI